MGIVMDDETQSLLLFVGNTSLMIDGETGKVISQGAIVENNGGDRKEDLVLQKNAGITSIIPSTITTPIPQSTISLPVTYVGGLASDIMNMMRVMLGG